MSAAPALLAALFAQNVPDDAALRREVCAILNLSERPGSSEMGSEEEAKRAFGQNTTGLRRAGNAAEPGCTPAFGIEEVLFSPDGRFAVSYGGWQAAPLAGAYGECHYEKVEGVWRTIACASTAVS
jgi:hypothetical protein